MIGIFRVFHMSGWRRNQPLFGKPDFVFAKQKIALFVDGCFWHGCPKHSNMPRNNEEFCKKKLGGNIKRDRYITRELRKMGWKVVRVWEPERRILQKSRQNYSDILISDVCRFGNQSITVLTYGG
jgi:DNA mismatch endonuclease (patch repair protein)